jgi:hypothetical protein
LLRNNSRSASSDSKLASQSEPTDDPKGTKNANHQWDIYVYFEMIEEMTESAKNGDLSSGNTLLTDIAAPYITQVTNTANILLTLYQEVVDKGLPITRDLQDTIASAIRRVFFAMQDLLDDIEEKVIEGDGAVGYVLPQRTKCDWIGSLINQEKEP